MSVEKSMIVSGERLNKAELDDYLGTGMTVDSYPFTRVRDGENTWISLADLEAGWQSERHFHNFDQVRYVAEGSVRLGDHVMEKGDCAYFPESVPYGPQVQDERAVLLAAQFPGASGQYYLTWDEQAKAVSELQKKSPETFGLNDAGEPVETSHLVWAENQGRKAEYAEPRFADIVIFRTSAFGWVPESDGVSRRHLATFGERRVELEMVQFTGPITAAANREDQPEFWFVTDGVIEHAGESYGRNSGLFLYPNQPGFELTPSPRAEVFIVRYARPLIRN